MPTETKKPTGPRTGNPPRDIREYRSMAEYRRTLLQQYKDGERSSRTTPQTAPVPALGTWFIESWHGLDGREIGETAEIDTETLEISEATGRARFADVRLYAAWLDEGSEPPPINVLQTDSGRLKTLDHRRLLAAKLVGRATIRAIVWWAAISDRSGQAAGLTYELACKGRRALETQGPRPGFTIHELDARLLAESRNNRATASAERAA